jgi:hypothetical protein
MLFISDIIQTAQYHCAVSVDTRRLLIQPPTNNDDVILLLLLSGRAVQNRENISADVS